MAGFEYNNEDNVFLSSALLARLNTSLMPTCAIPAYIWMVCATYAESDSGLSEHSFTRGFCADRGYYPKSAPSEGVLGVCGNMGV